MNLRSITYRWLQAQDRELKLWRSLEAAASHGQLPGWLHGKQLSSAAHTSIVCAADHESDAHHASGHYHSMVLHEYPVLKTMAVTQNEMKPADFPTTEETAGQQGVNKRIKSRSLPTGVQLALEAHVQTLLVCFRL
jgi:hypothetical protein